MSLSVEGQDCPVCGSHLFDDDDVVFCPVCGAPHHRDCYKSLGHCALEEFHGTDKEYKRPEPAAQPSEEASAPERVCAGCGTPLSDEALFCPKCGRNTAQVGQDPRQPYSGFVIDPLGGVNADEMIEDVPAGDVAKYVSTGTRRYIPLFKKLSKKHRVSWNWAAFLFPGGWLWYRKCYAQGFIFLAIAIFCTVLNFPTQMVINTLPISADGMMTYQQIMQLIYDNIDQFMGLPWLTAVISLQINIAQRVLCGLFGDYIYRCNALDKVRALRQHEQYPASLAAAGGGNVVALLAAFLITNWVPSLLLMFL